MGGRRRIGAAARAVHRAARTLRIDYGSLKKRLDTAGAGPVPTPAFVELPTAARPSELGPCVIDLAASRDRRLRIEVTGVTMADLVLLTQAAWARAR